MSRDKIRRILSTNWGLAIFLTLLAIAFSLVSAGIGIHDDGSGSPDKEFNETEIEALILEYVNERRTTNGMDRLRENGRATEAANENAENMAQKDYFNHTTPGGQTQQERYSFCNGGENIHQTWVDKQIQYQNGEVEMLTSEQEIAKSVVRGWMESDPHREQGIYGEPWTSAGTGVEITDEGKVYSVLGFCSR